MNSSFARALRAARLTVIVGMGTAVVAAAAGAQTGDAASLSLAGAVERTLERSPDLQGFVYELRAGQARAERAALRPPLEIRAELENVLGTGRTTVVDAAEATFLLSQVVELGDKRARRVSVAETAQALVAVDRAAAQLDVVAEVTRRFIHVASDQAQLALTERATRLANETLAAAEARVAAARAPEVEVRRARITQARAEIEQEHAEHELLASRRKLVAMWGDSRALFGSVDADLYALPALATFEALAVRLERNPDFLRFASAARLRDAEIRLAASRARADVAVSAGVRRLQQSRDHALVLAVSLPVGSAARAASTVREAQALRELTDAERAVHRVRAEAQLFEIYQELQHAITETGTLRDTVLPEMQAALEATREAFERGRYSYLEWVDAQRELVEVERALIEAAASAHLHAAEIERLTGEPLSPMNP